MNIVSELIDVLIYVFLCNIWIIHLDIYERQSSCAFDYMSSRRQRQSKYNYLITFVWATYVLFLVRKLM